MSENNCKMIRRELDESMLDEAYSSVATEHLRECAECREFQDKQTKLRQIVGSLGTVAAPPDFDFRLRARLANEASAASQFHYWPLARRGLAAAALLLVFATGAVVVRNVMNGPSGNEEIVSGEKPLGQQPEKRVEAVTPAGSVNSDKTLVARVPEKQPLITKSQRPTRSGLGNKRPMATIDIASTGAEVINGMEPAGAPVAFPIDVSLQTFKVSLDDGRGNARTISVPPISFGSQRIVQSANQFAPKRAW